MAAEASKKKDEEDAFKKYDKDNSNSIDSSEVLCLMKDMGLDTLLKTDEKTFLASYFEKYDQNNDGVLNFEEFKQAMEIVAPNFGAAELKGAFHASDTDGSGGVDKDEFMKRVSMFQQMSEDMEKTGAGTGSAASSASEKNLMALTAEERKEAEMLFKKFDKDKSGELDFSEFRKVMKIIAGEGLSDANMLKAFEECDKDGTGNIDYQEFLAGQTELKKWKQKRKPKKK